MMLIKQLNNIEVILGSQSPRRKELLTQMDISFNVEVKETEESFDPALSPEEIVRTIALKKIKAFCRDEYKNKLVIVADTLVANEKGQMLGKPKNKEEAKDMIRELSGKTHRVFSAVAFSYQGEVRDFVEETEVDFVTLEEDEIQYYVDKYLPLDKAGAYGIQEWLGKIAQKKLVGSQENVMGLPTSRLYQELKDFFADIK